LPRKAAENNMFQRADREREREGRLVLQDIARSEEVTRGTFGGQQHRPQFPFSRVRLMP